MDPALEVLADLEADPDHVLVQNLAAKVATILEKLRKELLKKHLAVTMRMEVMLKTLPKRNVNGLLLKTLMMKIAKMERLLKKMAKAKLNPKKANPLLSYLTILLTTMDQLTRVQELVVELENLFRTLI